MPEMPIDVIRNHMLHGFDEPLGSDSATDHALAIDQELQSKFLFFNIEDEVDSIEIVDRGEGAIQHLGAGSGPEECTAGHGDNPNWLWNHALNAMALARHLEKVQRQKFIDALPHHGWHVASTPDGFITVYVTPERRILSIGSNLGRLNDRTEEWFAGKLSHWTFRKLGDLIREAEL